MKSLHKRGLQLARVSELSPLHTPWPEHIQQTTQRCPKCKLGDTTHTQPCFTFLLPSGQRSLRNILSTGLSIADGSQTLSVTKATCMALGKPNKEASHSICSPWQFNHQASAVVCSPTGVHIFVLVRRRSCGRRLRMGSAHSAEGTGDSVL